MPQAMQRETDNANQVKRAVYLLRVSDLKQMYTATDIDPEGNSIPTQRVWCDTKNKELGAIKVGEYIEPGYSGQSIDKRPIFKDLIKRIIEHRDVDYVIIYMRSRIFRNYVEAAIVKQQLDKLGVKLISAKENFGEGYMAEAMEAVTDVFNWVQVRMNGEDIKTKMLNKAQKGGTNGRAKLGYQNTTVIIDGHKVNTIALDDERAPYVRMMFELWATGRYANIQQLCDKLTDAGLRMPRTGKPVSTQTLWKMLRDRYYVGYVTYKGVEYPGRHEALISEELFDRAQRVLDSHSGSGTRQRTHHHYLKGVVWCARCRQRFIVQRSKGRHGGIYYYFFCGGREDKTCDQPYVPVEVMEQAVEDHYGQAVRLSNDFRAQVRSAVDAAVATNHDLTDEMRDQYTRRLDKLDAKESYLLDLASEEGWPKDKLREKVQAIRHERKQIQAELDQAEQRLDTGRAIFHHALELLDNPQAMYQHGNEAVKTTLNKAFFTKLYVDSRKVTEHELQEPFDLLSEAYRLYEDYRRHQQAPRTYRRQRAPQTHRTAAPGRYGGSDLRSSLTDSLARALCARGSSKAVMVGDTGIEPVTSSV
jgi:site-specific DNA recombinase